MEDSNLVKILDAQALKLKYDDLVNYLAKFDVIIFPTTSFCFLEDMNFLNRIKSLNPEIKSIAFGSFPTLYPSQCISSPFLDYGIIGEPEYTIKNLLENIDLRIKKSNQIIKIKGLCYKLNGKEINTGISPFIENLDELPIPNRAYIKNIFYFNPLVKNKLWTSALTSRGCPASCNFCLSPEFYGKNYRFQTPNRMINELEYLLDLGYKEIFYRDETFTGNKKRIEKFCHQIINKKINVDWIGNVRIGTVNERLLRLMKESGCHYLKIGVESGSQLILDNLGKGIRIEDIKHTFFWANKINLKTHAHMILGAPGDTEDTIKTTINFIKNVKPTTVTFNLFTPFPGTKIFKDIETKIIENFKPSSQTFKDLLSKPFLNEYYTDLQLKYLNRIIPLAYKKFYLRTRFFLAQLKEIKSLFSLRKIFKSGLNVISFILSTSSEKNRELT